MSSEEERTMTSAIQGPGAPASETSDRTSETSPMGTSSERTLAEELSRADDLIPHLTPQEIGALATIQQSLVTEGAVYRTIAGDVKDEANAATLVKIADDHDALAAYLGERTHETPEPERSKVGYYRWIARLLGFTFAVKLMEKNKLMARRRAQELAKDLPEMEEARKSAERQEEALLGLLNEERLAYVGAMVLGMNDALVEMTGTLAGLTLAMQNTRLIALSGLITGIAATLSMAASEYLAVKSDGGGTALKSSIYTGLTYLVTVALLVAPYLIFDADHYLWAMATMIATVLIILIVFNFYISVAQGTSFKKRFGQMAAISLGVAALSFVLGMFVKMWLGVDI